MSGTPTPETPAPIVAAPVNAPVVAPTPVVAPVAVVPEAVALTVEQLEAQLVADLVALRDRAESFLHRGDVAFADEARGEVTMIAAVQRLWSLTHGESAAVPAAALPANLVTSDQLAGVVVQLKAANADLTKRLGDLVAGFTMGDKT